MRRWPVIAVAAVLVLGGGGALAYTFFGDPATGPFADALPGYMAQLTRARAGDIPEGITNFRAKVVVIDMAAKGIDAVQAKLPLKMRAASPAEVGTLIGIVCGTQPVGNYNDGRVAIEHRCRAWAVDMVEHRPMGQFYFVNPPLELGAKKPPARPDTQLVDYLKELRMR